MWIPVDNDELINLDQIISIIPDDRGPEYRKPYRIRFQTVLQYEEHFRDFTTEEGRREFLSKLREKLGVELWFG